MNPLSGVVGEAWAMYRRHAAHLIPIAFLVYVVAGILQAICLGLLGPVGAAIAAVISLVAAFLLQAALVKAVEDLRDGRADLSLAETVQAARSAVPKVAVASIIAGVGIAIGLVLIIIPGLILLTLWCLIVPVIVLERATVGAAFSRSMALVKPHAMQVFGTLVLVFIMLLAADLVIGLILSALPSSVSSLLSGIISGTLVSPFLAVVLTLGYYRLRAVEPGSRPTGSYGYGGGVS